MPVDKLDVEAMEKRLGRFAAEAVKIVGAGVRVATNALRDGIAAAAPVGPERVVRHNEIHGGGLGFSIGARMKRQRAEIVQAKAGIGVGKNQVGFGVQVSRGKNATPYGHFVALGTSERFTGERTSKGRSGRIYRKKTGNRVMARGRVLPRHFVEEGYDRSKGLADQRAFEEIGKRLQALERSTG